jgi:hypothetical protein
MTYKLIARQRPQHTLEQQYRNGDFCAVLLPEAV